MKRITCSWCKKEIDLLNEFKDALSKKEYSISGFCQKCQDDTFGVKPSQKTEPRRKGK